MGSKKYYLGYYLNYIKTELNYLLQKSKGDVKCTKIWIIGIYRSLKKYISN